MESLEDIARTSPTDAAALAALKAAGASPIKAIRALADGRGLTLEDAKRALGESPDWSAETQAADELHSEILKTLEGESLKYGDETDDASRRD